MGMSEWLLDFDNNLGGYFSPRDHGGIFLMGLAAHLIEVIVSADDLLYQGMPDHIEFGKMNK